MALFTGCNNTQLPGLSSLTKEKDSISIWLDNARTDTLPLPNRKQFLTRAYLQTRSLADSTKQEFLRKIAYRANGLNDSLLFQKANREALRLSYHLRDTFAMGDTHWNYGIYYLDRETYDSAYYHYQEARKLFERVPHPYYSGKMLYNMAYILGHLKDYTGSEVLLFQAIPKFESEGKYKQLYQCYNFLGVIYDELKEYKKAISYHKKALEYLKKVDDKSVYLQDSQNNIGLSYQNQGDQPQALTYFNEVLNDPFLKSKDIKLYARVLDNKAFSNFLNNDTINILRDFQKALRIRHSVNHIPGIIISKLHLAQYYGRHKDTARAISLAGEAFDLATSIHNNRDVLTALHLLSRLDHGNSSTYLEKYIRLSNELREKERRRRNKFIRIHYETEQYIERTRQLSAQKLWISVIAAILILLLLLLYILNRQYARNKLLYMETSQQKANEQIYLLTLKQQAKLQEGRNQERIRISEELHDGILGDLFGIRMDWGFLKLEGDAETLRKHRYYLEELHRIEKRIREASHELKEKLTPYPLDFILMVKRLIRNRAKTGNFEYNLIHDDTIAWDEADDFVKVNLYRIIEEALQNCIKHARASVVCVRFKQHKNRLRLIIQDDGVGFSPRKRNKGIGIRNMQSRVRKLKGTFQVDSGEQQGTTLTVSIPL